MRTVVVTGGCGFIGSNLVGRILATTPHHVVVIDKVTYASSQLAMRTTLRDPRVTFIQADIRNQKVLARVFAEHRPSWVLNLAAETHVDRSIDGPWPFVDTNICGTVALLEASLGYLRDCPNELRQDFRFLQVSTDEVYGTLGATGRFVEMTPYAPNSPYAASKASADHLVSAFGTTYGLPALITNCSNNYGPFQHPEKLIPLMILNALDARPLPIYGDGQNVRDWLHVEDHCDALLLVLTNGRPGDTYNIGASNERSNIQIVEQLCNILDDIVPARNNASMRAAGLESYHSLKHFVADRPGHDRRYAVDATKLRQQLGWSPRYSMDVGLPSTVQWYVENRSALTAETLGYDRQRLGASLRA